MTRADICMSTNERKANKSSIKSHAIERKGLGKAPASG